MPCFKVTETLAFMLSPPASRTSVAGGAEHPLEDLGDVVRVGFRASTLKPTRTTSPRSSSGCSAPPATLVRLAGGDSMKAKVSVTLKQGILDPQGQAVLHALSSLGYTGVKDVRVGKLIELELATNDRAGAGAEVKAMCERLLANTIIEEYRIELLE